MVWTTFYFAIWPLFLLLTNVTAYYERESSKNGPKRRAFVGHYYNDEINYQSFGCNISRMEIFEKFTRKLPTWLTHNTTNGDVFGIPQEQDIGSYDMLLVEIGINKFQQEFICGHYSWTIDVELEARSLSVALRHVFDNATDSAFERSRFSNCVNHPLVSVATLRVATKLKHATRHLTNLANAISAYIGLPLRSIQIVRSESSLPFFKQLKRLNIIRYGELSTKERDDHAYYVSWPLGCGAVIADSFNIREIHRRSISDTGRVSLNSWHLTSGEIDRGFLVRKRRGVFFGSITALEGTPLETSALPSLILSSAVFTSLRSTFQESSVITSVSKMFSSTASSAASSFQVYSTLSKPISFSSFAETQYATRPTLSSSALRPSTDSVLPSYTTQQPFNVNSTTKMQSSFSIESISRVSFSETTQSTTLLTMTERFSATISFPTLISSSADFSKSECISAPCSTSITKPTISMSLANNSTLNTRRHTDLLQSSQMLSTSPLPISQTSSFLSNTSSKTITSTVPLYPSSATVFSSTSHKINSTILTVSPTSSFQINTPTSVSTLPGSSAVSSKLKTLKEFVVSSTNASFDIKPTSVAFTPGIISTTPNTALASKITSRSIFASDIIAPNRSSVLVSTTSISSLLIETSIQPLTTISNFETRSFTATFSARVSSQSAMSTTQTSAVRVPNQTAMSTIQNVTSHFSSISSNALLMTSRLLLTTKSISVQSTKDYSTEIPKKSSTSLSTLEFLMPSSLMLSSSLSGKTAPPLSTISSTVTSTAYTSVFPVSSELPANSTLLPTSFVAKGNQSSLATQFPSHSPTSSLTAYSTAPLESMSVNSYQTSKSALPDVRVSTTPQNSSINAYSTSTSSSFIELPTTIILSSSDSVAASKQTLSVQQSMSSKLMTTSANSSGSKIFVTIKISFNSNIKTSPIEMTLSIPQTQSTNFPTLQTATYLSQLHFSSLVSDTFKVVSTKILPASTFFSKSVSKGSAVGTVLISSLISALYSTNPSLQGTVPSLSLFTGSGSTILVPSMSTKPASYATSLSVQGTVPNLSLFTGSGSTILLPSTSTKQASYATSLSVQGTVPSLSLFTGVDSTIRAPSISTNQATSSFKFSTLRKSSQSKTESFSSRALVTTVLLQASSISTSYFNHSAYSSVPSISIVTPNTVITTSLPDTSPTIVNSIGVVFAYVGIFFTYKIPYDTFYDKEDGWTTNMKLICRYETGTPLPKALWVSFDNTTQTLSGLAFVEDYNAQGAAGVRLEIIATDKSGNSARDVFNVYIQNPRIVLQFSISAKIATSYNTFLMDGSIKRTLFKRIIDFYNTTTQSFYATSLRNGSAIFSWSDMSISGDTCNTSAIRNNLNKIRLPSGSPTSEFSQALLPEFPLLSLTMSYQGVCVLPTTTPLVPIGPVSGAQTKEVFVRYVVPTLAVALLLALIIATFIFISKRRRMKPSFLDKHTFRKGQPILLPEEYELDLYNGPTVTLPEDYAYDEKSLDERQSDEEPLDYEDAPFKNNPIYGLTSFKQPPPPYPQFSGADGAQSDYESPYARPPPTYTLPPAYFPPDLMTSEV